jgi:hypothetical protein
MMVTTYSASGKDFVASKPRLWVDKKDLSDMFDLAPDGARFAVVRAEASEQKGPTQVPFVLNFFDELRRRAPKGAK